LESAAAELRDATGNDAVRTAVCNVTEEERVQHAVATATEDGGLDVLVANAGTAWPGPVRLMDNAQWHIAYDVNVIETGIQPSSSSCVVHGMTAVAARQESPPYTRGETQAGGALPLALGAGDSFPAARRSIHVEVP
jgi:NAD(P)-dependent dehydrogenase (short-subunit alcohol dehydrogenase family)